MKEMLKRWYGIEKEKMVDMTREEKLEYIFAYYKGWFALVIIVLAIIVWIPYHFIFSKTEVEFRCAVVNGVLEDSDIELSEALSEYLGFDSSKEYAYFDTEYQISYPGVENEAADVSFYEKFFLNIRTGSLDVAIMPQTYLDYCNSLDRIFYDVKDVLKEEQIEEYRPYFVTGKDADGIEYVCGIDISHFEFFEEEEFNFVLNNNDEPIILTFPCNAEHKELCQAFLVFLEEYKK